MTLRWMTAGESHGPALVGILSGLPAGLNISIDAIDAELACRQKGIGRSVRQQIESDKVRVLAGIRHELTIGSPIAVLIENKDYVNWQDVMSPSAGDAADLNKSRALPRPGHADLAGMLKYGFDDARNVLERASGRTTAVTVTLGAICKQYLQCFEIYVGNRIISFGPVKLVSDESIPTRADIGDPIRLKDYGKLTDEQVGRIEKAVQDARDQGDTLGGKIQVVASHVPPGLGSYALHDERLDARLASAVFSVPGIKAMEIGLGTVQATMGGKEAHDRYARDESPDHEPWYGRSSNNAGGIEGGVTNGEPVCITVSMKPLSTIHPPNISLDPATKEAVMPESSERSDVAAVESVACVLEAVVALELTKAHLDKFAGDSIAMVKASVESYNDSISV